MSDSESLLILCKVSLKKYRNKTCKSIFARICITHDAQHRQHLNSKRKIVLYSLAYNLSFIYSKSLFEPMFQNYGWIAGKQNIFNEVKNAASKDNFYQKNSQFYKF